MRSSSVRPWLLRLRASRLRNATRISPERLWLISTALHNRGHARLARRVRKLNSNLFHNHLSPAIALSPDIRLGHRGLGVVVHRNVEIGRRVMIWQNATIAVRALKDSPHRVVIEDDVVIGANAVVITPKRASIRIGRGARVGAGVVVTHDVPAGATIVPSRPRVLHRDDAADAVQGDRADDEAEEEDRPPHSLAPAPET